MHLAQFFTAAFIAALSTNLHVEASPIAMAGSESTTPTFPLAARSFASVECPTFDNQGEPYEGYDASAGQPDGNYQCSYGTKLSTAYCYYDLNNGQLFDPEEFSERCPSKAIFAGCSMTVPEGPQYFKRSKMPMRRSASEEAIQRRQFKPSFRA